ncbi:hypothetical protein CSOJ01_01215 [Colletotrichum sojae]|uniref:Uncharacterized protein n=1 Tax=Colletotrichum sojae TaxID=2175907 RepID=A0A8H6JVK4_9PEZI|nr:hypothetical protein CSOJ01_01215 [Colletotrichum sojae]
MDEPTPQSQDNVAEDMPAARHFAFATAVAQGSSHVYHNVQQQTRLRLRTSTRVARASNSKSVVATVVDEAVVMGLGLEFRTSNSWSLGSSDFWGPRSSFSRALPVLNSPNFSKKSRAKGVEGSLEEMGTGTQRCWSMAAKTAQVLQMRCADNARSRGHIIHHWPAWKVKKTRTWEGHGRDMGGTGMGWSPTVETENKQHAKIVLVQSIALRMPPADISSRETDGKQNGNEENEATVAAGTTRLSSATDGGWESPRDRVLHHVSSSSEPTIDRHRPELYSVVGGPAPLDLRPRRESRSKRPRHTVAARPEPSLLARQHRKWNGRIFAKAGPKTTAGVEYSTRQNRRRLWGSATYRGPSPCGAPVPDGADRTISVGSSSSSSDTEVRIAPTTSITPVGGMQTLAIEYRNYSFCGGFCLTLISLATVSTQRYESSVSPRVERAGTTPSPDKEERNATMTGSRGLGIGRWGWRGIAFFVMDSQ